MSLASGTRMDPYEILAPVGTGGMGEVYRAKDTRLDRTVAINSPAIEPLERRAAEGAVQARSPGHFTNLSHPHICTLHDIGHQDGIDYLVMEFLEGETLSNHLSKGALPTQLEIGIQIANALDKAHKKGIVHRDLKPGNIMITRTGAKLLDFGLAKLEQPVLQDGMSGASELSTQYRDLTEDGHTVGTFQYMAPGKSCMQSTCGLTLCDQKFIGVIYEIGKINDSCRESESQRS